MVRTSGVKDGQNHHYEQQQLRTKNIESHQSRRRLVSFDARRHPTFHERQGLIWLVPIKKQFFLVRDFRRGERFNNQIQKSWWKVFRSLELESFIIWNGTSQIISKKHENSVSAQEDFFIDWKQRNPEKVENQRSITLFQSGIPRDSKP